MDQPATSTELDPQLAAVLREGRLADLPQWHTLSVREARRLEDEAFSAGSGPPLERVEDRLIDGPDGDVPVRLYRPETPERRGESLPALVFCHGGGWVLGTLDSADDVCRGLASRVGAVVVSIDYRLAPEHPFPAAVDDAWTALRSVRDRAESLGVDPDRIGVAGTSAGGNLAAAVALRARDADLSLAVQVLWYPILDRDFETPSYREHADAPLLSRADMRWFWRQYLADPDDATDPLAAPLRAGALADSPPAVVATAGHDVLRSEGVAYAERLQEAGVDVRHCHYPSLAHGFLSLTDEVERAGTAMAEMTDAVREALPPQ